MKLKWLVVIVISCLMVVVLSQAGMPRAASVANAQSVTPTPTPLPQSEQPDDVSTRGVTSKADVLTSIRGSIAALNFSNGCSVVSSQQGSITTTNPIEAGRLFRNASPGTCATRKSFPGLWDSNPYHYSAHWFTNSSGVDRCYAVDITQSCGVPNPAFFTTYLNSFNAADPSLNYLADSGVSPLPTGAYSFTVPAGANFGILVNEVTSNAGCSNYAFNLRACSCWSTSVTDSITNTDSLTQTGRLYRQAPASTCALPKAFPGIVTGANHYKVYHFANSTGATACYKVDVSAPSCLGSQYISVSAYLDPYDPSNLSANYLADIGTSPNPSGSFSFHVPAGQAYALVVNEVYTNQGCPGYTLNISNCAYQACIPAVQR